MWLRCEPMWRQGVDFVRVDRANSADLFFGEDVPLKRVLLHEWGPPTVACTRSLAVTMRIKESGLWY